MKKKITAILLVLILCAGCLGASAVDIDIVGAVDFPVMGLTFTYPAEMMDAKGMIAADGAQALSGTVYYAYWYYTAVPEEELRQMAELDWEYIAGRTELLFYLFAVGENQDARAVTELTDGALTEDSAVLIGKNGSWSYYLYMRHNPAFAGAVPAEFYEEYTALCGMEDKYIAACSLYAPFNEYSDEPMDGKIIRFTAKDFDGNPVSSEELFAQHEITMVNLWATWCGPCVGELAELQAIHTRFLEKDCAVLGVLTDDDLASAKSLMKQNGVTYQVVLAPANIAGIFPYEGIPTSFFVDREGRFLGTKITGAYSDLYEPSLEPLLEAAKTAAE